MIDLQIVKIHYCELDPSVITQPTLQYDNNQKCVTGQEFEKQHQSFPEILPDAL